MRDCLNGICYAQLRIYTIKKKENVLLIYNFDLCITQTKKSVILHMNWHPIKSLGDLRLNPTLHTCTINSVLCTLFIWDAYVTLFPFFIIAIAIMKKVANMNVFPLAASYRFLFPSSSISY